MSHSKRHIGEKGDREQGRLAADERGQLRGPKEAQEVSGGRGGVIMAVVATVCLALPWVGKGSSEREGKA